ncbi:hypothetical protein [Apibacter adventoris]|uniref:hypothetical protein n=1 Tax=Apibacter adventoris TaxID=1679466 RepID=UPI000CF6D030|nr:hypothetical protein [Apibacter adventoris]PQL94430.1 hypothetical protein C4S76_05235 [Apibacter adventoris]
MKYNCLTNKKDTINNEDSIKRYKLIFEDNYKKKNDLVDFKFPEAEKYYKIVNKEYYSEISEEKKNKILEEYKDSKEEIKQAVIETRSLRYNILYAELQMPKEKIHFKFNSNLNKNINFFGNEELYKKGYIFIYIYKNYSKIPHSGGLYVIRPKTKK